MIDSASVRCFGDRHQQLLRESEIFKGEVRSGTESTDNPSQEMSERRADGQNHDQNLIEIRRIKLVCKSFIPRLHEVLTRDNHADEGSYQFRNVLTNHKATSDWIEYGQQCLGERIGKNLKERNVYTSANRSQSVRRLCPQPL